MGLFSSFFKAAPSRPPLRLRNTLSGALEEFVPMGKTVKMYNCGPTVYDRQHIGNLRAALFADTLRRLFVAWGYRVDQVINITDFGHLSGDNEGDADQGEDRMTRGLLREGLALNLENMRTLGTKYMEAYFADLDLVGVERSRIRFPRASDYISQQVELILRLEQKGAAYKTESGVYFDTSTFAEYGKLGNINLSGQEAGVRVEVAGKKNPRDFVLWKSDPKLGWRSPWGMGFPGWHIECTAMIFELLGEQIDVHTGGIEHIAIHHNNEIAQAEAATGKNPFVRYWLHNDHAQLDGKKLAKSTGNTLYVQDLVARGFEPRALRYLYLTAHYRSPINVTVEALGAAQTALTRLRSAYQHASAGPADHRFLDEFYRIVGQDLDTPRALALLWENVQKLNKKTLDEVDKLFGLNIPASKAPIAVPADVQKLLDEREAARKAKDFTRSDALRTQLETRGFIIEDTPAGPQISKK